MKILIIILFPLFTFGQQAQKLFFLQNKSITQNVLGQPSSVCAFSVRLLDTSYHGYCMKVRRSSDSTEQNIGFVSGNLDTATLKAFVGTGSGYVSIWYDQSSLGNNATQTVLSGQPLIDSAGIIYRENAKPALSLNGTSMYLNIASRPLTNFSSFTFLAVANFKNTDDYEMLFTQANGTSSSGVFEVRRYDLNNKLQYITNIAYNGTLAINGLQKSISIYQNSSSISTYLNGVSDVTGTGTPAPIGNFPCYIGWRNITYYFGGTIQEIIIYKGNREPYKTSLESNINSYYVIY